jgi:predicted ATP-grasp superfamily ATP-dependent carboligase
VKPLPVVIGLEVNGYGMVRSLAKAGIAPAGVARDPLDFAGKSRFLRQVAFSGAEAGGDRLAEELRRLSQAAGRPLVLFPTADEIVVELTDRRQTLGEFCLYHWNPVEALRLGTDKIAMGALCESLGIRAPRTEQPASLTEVESVAARATWPVIVKPRSGGDTPFPPGVKNAIAENPGELMSLYRSRPTLVGRTLCQEIVAGPDSDIFQVTALMRSEGREPVVSCVRKRRQYPRQRGTTSFGVTQWNPDLVELALRLLGALRWNGVGSIEFKLSPAGVPYFIELNPRLPWYNHLFAVSGVNLPALMYEDLADAEGGGAELPRQRDGVAWGHLANDFASHRAARPRPGAGAWIRWAIAHLSARASAWRCLSDPMPGLAAYAALFRSLRTPPPVPE